MTNREFPADTGELREAIKTRMAELSISQAALSRRADIPKATLSEFLSGKTAMIRIETLAPIAASLETTVGALLGELPGAPVPSQARPHSEIRPNPDNPRKTFDPARLDRLANSILHAGLIVPLLVDETGMLIDGERRWRAIGQLIEQERWPAGREIPVVLGDPRPAGGMTAASLIANLQREDIAPLEEARAIDALMSAHGFSTSDVAEAIGTSQRHVQLRLALIHNLAPETQAALAGGRISLAAARALTAAPAEQQASAVTEIEAGRYGWRTADEIHHQIFNRLIPVGRNIFKLEAWPGEIVEDPEDPERRYFGDSALFAKVQREAVEARKADLLADGYEWVEIVDRTTGDDWKPWHWKQDARRKAGVVIELCHDLSVDVHAGLYKETQADLEDFTTPGSGAKPPAAGGADPEPGPSRPTKKHLAACHKARTRVLQVALAARPDLALRAAVLALMIHNDEKPTKIKIDHPRSDDKQKIPDLDELAERYGGPFKHMREHLFRDRDPLQIDAWNAEMHAQAWDILCGLPDSDVAGMHALMVARLTGSWINYEPRLGDGPLVCAMAGALGLEMTAHAAEILDRDFLKTCNKTQLLELARTSSAGHALNGIKLGELVDLVRTDIEGGAIAGTIPATLDFGSEAELEARLPKREA